MTSSSFLLLGEGDFTYSLDLCRFIVASSCATTIPDADDEVAVAGAIRPKSATAPDGLGSIVSIACTGVDTLQELREKYKDIDFVLRNIRKCNKMQSRVRLETTILHGINAVDARCNYADDNDRLQSFDHVIFNHPHLGTEDAQLHTRFLHHLFHACVNRWMKPRTGLLHLTLVNGQCSRWKCIEGATKHGLVLRRRKTFGISPSSGSSPGEKYKVEIAKIQSKIQKISYGIPPRTKCTGGGSRQKGETASSHKRTSFPPNKDHLPAISLVPSRQKRPELTHFKQEKFIYSINLCRIAVIFSVLDR